MSEIGSVDSTPENGSELPGFTLSLEGLATIISAGRAEQDRYNELVERRRRPGITFDGPEAESIGRQLDAISGTHGLRIGILDSVIPRDDGQSWRDHLDAKPE